MGISPFSFLTLEDAIPALARGTTPTAEEEAAVVRAVNAALERLERYVNRRLRLRFYREPVGVTLSVTASSGAFTLAEAPSTALRVGDVLTMSAGALASIVTSVSSTTGGVLWPKPASDITAQAATLGIGSELVRTFGDREVWLPEYPLAEIVSARSVGTDHSLEALDLTDALIFNETGLVRLASYNTLHGYTRCEFVAGVASGTSTFEAMASFQLRIAQVVFQEWQTNMGGAEDTTAGAAGIRLDSGSLPSSVRFGLDPHCRRW